jgi:hypothetical protein
MLCSKYDFSIVTPNLFCNCIKLDPWSLIRQQILISITKEKIKFEKNIPMIKMRKTLQI